MASLVDEGLCSAKRHFLGRGQDIDALAQQSERFRDLCDELAIAEAALAAVDRVDEARRAERRLEWLAYIRSALTEIEVELHRINVTPLRRDDGGQGR